MVLKKRPTRPPRPKNVKIQTDPIPKPLPTPSPPPPSPPPIPSIDEQIAAEILKENDNIDIEQSNASAALPENASGFRDRPRRKQEPIQSASIPSMTVGQVRRALSQIRKAGSAIRPEHLLVSCMKPVPTTQCKPSIPGLSHTKFTCAAHPAHPIQCTPHNVRPPV